MLHRRRPELVLPASAWRKPWIVHVTCWGAGAPAVLDYLARYVFRVAITNARIIGLDDDTVTIRYQQRKSPRPRTSRIASQEFLRRFLQHVLPKGFHKVRYFGLWHPTNRNLAAAARLMLGLDHPAATVGDAVGPDAKPVAGGLGSAPASACPHCRIGHLVLIGRLTPRNPMGP